MHISLLAYLLSIGSLLQSNARSSAGDRPLEFSGSNTRHPVKSEYKRLPSLREQAAIEERWTRKREELVPSLLEKYGFDAYLLSMREYAEDTIFRAFNSFTTTFSARRRTTYLFHTSPPALAPSPLLLIDNTPQLWVSLNETLTLLNPQKIAVNIDRGIAFSDGLHSGEGEAMRDALDSKWVERLSSERMLGVEVISARVGGKEQLEIYRNMQESVWAMIEEGFSTKVITPGVTTADDLIWWFRERMQTMNVTTWFHPSVSLFRADFATNPEQPFPSPGDSSTIILGGDMIHTDIGIYAMGMATDTQHLAYVLRSNETDAPTSLKHGLHTSNRLQDLVLRHMAPGRTGDEVLARIRHAMADEGLEGLIYCHPIGDFGHSAGTPIGMTNLQKHVPISGELPMLKNSWYSIELSAAVYVPEWRRTQHFFQEEDVYWSDDKNGWDWVWGRQEAFHLVGRTFIYNGTQQRQDHADSVDPSAADRTVENLEGSSRLTTSAGFVVQEERKSGGWWRTSVGRW